MKKNYDDDDDNNNNNMRTTFIILSCHPVAPKRIPFENNKMI